MRTYFGNYECPLGRLVLKGDGEFLTGLWIEGEKHASQIGDDWVEDEGVFGEVKDELDEYFRGERKEFTVKRRFEGGTVFQREVWEALCGIGYGETISYGELARRVGRPAGMRAVGLANGQNPLSIVVPCHRVIGANGTLTGYGGGLEAKQWLLTHELRHAVSEALVLEG